MLLFLFNEYKKCLQYIQWVYNVSVKRKDGKDMKKIEKGYTVNDWFGNKVASECKRNITMCDVFAILKETPKAVYAMLSVGCDSRKCMWVPKSCLIETTGETVVECTYDEAVEEFRSYWSLYR